MKIQIAPSLLSANFLHLEKEIQAVESAGADQLHIDVMDGHFVPNLTIGPFIIEHIKRATKLPLDVHLMIENPDSWIEAYADAGADWLTVHFEASPHTHRTLQAIQGRKIKAGVSINPATPAHVLSSVLQDCDHVLVMSVNPGFGGQKFIAHSVDKIKELSSMIQSRKLKTLIEVDGGITEETAPLVIGAGAKVLVAGTSIFKQKDYKKSIQSLRGS